jgi:archaellum biogenesis protein FlaJ (TadC family)
MFGELPFRKMARGLFYKILQPYFIYFDALKTNIKKSGIKTHFEDYLCAISFYSLLGFMISVIAGSVFISLFIPLMSRNPSPYDMVYSYTLAINISIAVAALVFIFGYYYPSIKAKAVRSRIERALPFTVFFMATTSSSRINPVEMFRMLASRGGVLSKEAEKIFNDVNSLGMDLADALQKAASRSPSPMFADLMWSMATILTTGGNMQKYLEGKTRTYMSQYRRNLENYASQIGLYTEVYITLVIVGSLFFIVLLSIMGPLVGGATFSLLLQTFIVFFFIPAVSIGFIVLLKGLYPSE